MLQMHFADFAFVVLTFFLVTGVHSQRIRFETDDDNPANQSPPSLKSCDASSYCTLLEKCRPLRRSRNWQTTGVTCGPGRWLSRKVCCPRPETLPSENDNCGQSRGKASEFLFIHLGSVPAEGKWPWMVAITIRNSTGVYMPWCSGFLIDRRHVISAAHCFHRREDGLYSTRIGSVNQNHGEEYPIDNIVVPKGYKPGIFIDDIAILTLTTEVDHLDYNPICLPDAELINRNLVDYGTTVAGWGAESPGDQKIILKNLEDIPVVSIQDCDNIYRKGLAGFRKTFPQGINESFICAGFIGHQRDTCGGDIGGPLMLQDRDKWFAIGVMLSDTCELPGIPSVYTRISTHLSWIWQNTRNQTTFSDMNDSDAV